MVKTIISPTDFNAGVEAFDRNGDSVFAKGWDDLTFMQAADYFEQSVNYFRFALLDHPNWVCVQIEINSPYGVVEVIEITR